MAKGTVKLISAEGFEFIVDYKAACVSATFKNMLSSQGAPMACMVRVSCCCRHACWSRWQSEDLQLQS